MTTKQEIQKAEGNCRAKIRVLLKELHSKTNKHYLATLWPERHPSQEKLWLSENKGALAESFYQFVEAKAKQYNCTPNEILCEFKNLIEGHK